MLLRYVTFLSEKAKSLTKRNSGEPCCALSRYAIKAKGNKLFIIEDEIHAEWCGRFASFSEALTELQERSKIAWNQEPNKCPCTSWKTCEREYSIVEYDSSIEPWRELSRAPILKISSIGASWEKGFETDPKRIESR